MQLRRRDSGETRDLTSGMTLGRLPACDWTLDDASISRQHARLSLEGGTWVLEDLGSSNGSQRNGQRGKRHELAGGDLVTLGTVAFDVLAPAAAPAAAAASPAREAASAPTRPGRSQETERARAQLRHELRGDRRSQGLGDLSQQSLPIKLLAMALGLGVMAAIIYGVRFLGGWL